MKTYKCVKSWKRHGIGTTINEWEYTKLPINIKANHFQEVEYVGASTLHTTIVNPTITTPNSDEVSQTSSWTVGSKTIDSNVTLAGDVVTVDHSTSREVNVISVGPDFGNTPLTTFSSGNKFKDKIRPKVEDDIRPAE